MENNSKVYMGIVVRDFRFEHGTTKPLKYPYGFIHPEHEGEFELLKTKNTRELVNHINSVKKEENIQFILPSCQVPASQEACKNNDDVKRGDLVSFTYHIGSNGFPQARDVKVVKAFGAGQTPFYAEPTLEEAAKELARGSSVENAVNILIDEFNKEHDDKFDDEEFDDEEEKEYSEEDFDRLDDQDNY